MVSFPKISSNKKILLLLLFLSLSGYLEYMYSVKKWEAEVLAHFFDLKKENLSKFKVYHWEGFFGEIVDSFMLELKSETDFERYLAMYYLKIDKADCDKMKQAEDNFFSESRGYIKWWKPEKNTQFEFYKIKSNVFKGRSCFGTLYFSPEDKVVYAEFIRNSFDGTGRHMPRTSDNVSSKETR